MVRVNLNINIKNGLRMMTNMPNYTKAIVIIICLLSLLNWLLNAFNQINLADKISLKIESLIYQPWSLISHLFIERNILTLIINITLYILFSHKFEVQWGSIEYIKFIVLVSFISSLSYCIFFVGMYAFFGNLELLKINAMGLIPLISSFSVALKQSYPEYKIKLFGAFGFKLKQLPSILISIITIGSIIFKSLIPDMVLSWDFIFVAWIYLRFFKIMDNICGDRSETFSFVSFFPTIFRPPLKIVSNFGFNLLVKLRCCSPIHTISSYDVEAGLNRSSNSLRPNHLTVNLSVDSERRKALALKALDERLRLSTPTESLSSSKGTLS